MTIALYTALKCSKFSAYTLLAILATALKAIAVFPHHGGGGEEKREGPKEALSRAA